MTAQPTRPQTIALLRHLAAGKNPDTVAAITNLTRAHVIEIASHHGYPTPAKMTKAADLLAKADADDRLDQLPPGTPDRIPGANVARTTPTTPVVATGTTPVIHVPRNIFTPASDPISATLTAADQTGTKRIQNLARRIHTDLDRLRTLLEEHRAQAAERERQAQATAEARAEVDRLRKLLAKAAANLNSARTKRPLEHGEYPCPDSCGRVFTTQQGARMHHTRAHAA